MRFGKCNPLRAIGNLEYLAILCRVTGRLGDLSKVVSYVRMILLNQISLENMVKPKQDRTSQEGPALSKALMNLFPLRL